MSQDRGIDNWEERTQAILDWIHRRNHYYAIPCNLPHKFDNNWPKAEKPFPPKFFLNIPDTLKNHLEDPSFESEEESSSDSEEEFPIHSDIAPYQPGSSHPGNSKPLINPVHKLRSEKPAKMAPIKEEGSNELSAPEIKLASSIFKNIIGKPSVNWAQVAVEAGFKDANIAKVRFNQIRRKHGWTNNDDASAVLLNGATMEDSMVDEYGLPSFATPTARVLAQAANASAAGVKGGKVKKPRARKDPNTPVKHRKGSKAWLAAQACLQEAENAAVEVKDEDAKDKEEDMKDTDHILEESATPEKTDEL